MSLVEIVKQDFNFVEFSFVEYKNGGLRYKSGSGYEVVIPADEIGDGALKATESGVTLMKWIKQQEKERANESI